MPNHLRVQIFADGANKADMLALYQKPYIRGFTTNPTLMRKAGITHYAGFAKDMVQAIPDRPISFEVFSDDLPAMALQAREIATWGPNVNVKIPITNTQGQSCCGLIKTLAQEGIALNVTAITTLGQVRDVVASVKGTSVPVYISVFAGRIADTGVDPLPVMRQALELMSMAPNTRLIWASPRELLNVVQAHDIGCHVITVTSDILAKLPLLGKNLEQYSLETVQMFYNDATAAGFSIALPVTA